MTDLHLRFSRELSGFEDTPIQFVESVLRRAVARFGASTVDQVLRAYEQGGIAAALSTNRGVVRAILYCFYTGLLPDEEGKNILHSGPTSLTANDHFQALMWRAIQAHPPALSGGYFGHWHYPPEDA